MNHKDTLTLETERLILRIWSLDDLDDFYEYAKNPCVGLMAGWKPHESKEETLCVLKYNINNDGRWAIVLKETGKIIGSLNIKPDNNRGKYYAKLLSFALSADYWGNGYMTEAVKRIIQYIFEEMKVELLTAFHYPHNSRSKRVIEKCGFIYEGTIENGSTIYDGQVFDSVCYSILSQDYFAKRNSNTCYCGHDCSRCITYLATINNDDDLRKQSQEFYRTHFGRDIPLSQINCYGGRSGNVFLLCKECPWMKCCKEKELSSCSDCEQYPCKPFSEYNEKYVNKYNQI